jgi:methoxymalonate biosynthesis acyl carrier protein
MAHATREALRGFVYPRFPEHLVEDHEDIFALGFVNSLFAMELVMFIEKKFETQIPNEEMDLRNFRTMDAMVELVGRLASSDPARTAS